MNAAERLRHGATIVSSDALAKAMETGVVAIDRVEMLEEALKELADTCDELMERHGISADTSKARAALATADALEEKKAKSQEAPPRFRPSRKVRAV